MPNFVVYCFSLFVENDVYAAPINNIVNHRIKNLSPQTARQKAYTSADYVVANRIFPAATAIIAKEMHDLPITQLREMVASSNKRAQ